MLAWFPEITLVSPPPPTAAFLHFFCGLLTLADWVGSERRAFPFEPLFHPDDWSIAQDRAAAGIAQIGLGQSVRLCAPAEWSLISDHFRPRPAQNAIGALPTRERRVLLEAETGSGRTEAALGRFARLLEAHARQQVSGDIPLRYRFGRNRHVLVVIKTES